MIAGGWKGNDRRAPDPMKTEIKAEIGAIVAEAVRDALRGENLIDGPRHVAHHQAIDEFLSLAKHAKKTAVGGFVMGVLVLVVLGIAVWRQ